MLYMIHSPGVIHHLPAPAVSPAGQGCPGLGHLWSQAGGELIQLAQHKVWLPNTHTDCRGSSRATKIKPTPTLTAGGAAEQQKSKSAQAPRS